MSIEHVTDRNSTTGSTIGVIGMIGTNDLQRTFVNDHIADLEREGAALRAERDRDHLLVHGADGATATEHPLDGPSRRVRLGRWLVSVGEAISGPPRRPTAMAGSSSGGSTGSAPAMAGDGPCDDGPDRLAPAA
jgi:hypothetical protein